MVRNGSGESFYSAVGRRALASLLLLAFLELPIAFWCAGVGAETAPFLQLETGGHLAQVKALVFTPDNRFLVSGGDDKVIRIWSTLSGKLVRTISGELGPGKQGQAYALSVSSDGKWLSGPNSKRCRFQWARAFLLDGLNYLDRKTVVRIAVLKVNVLGGFDESNWIS